MLLRRALSFQKAVLSSTEALIQTGLKFIVISFQSSSSLIYFWFAHILCLLSFRVLNRESGPVCLADPAIQFLPPQTTRLVISALWSTSPTSGRYCLRDKSDLEGKSHSSAILYPGSMTPQILATLETVQCLQAVVSWILYSCSQQEDWWAPSWSIIARSRDIFTKNTEWDLLTNYMWEVSEMN